MEVGELLLALYAACHEAPLGEFQGRAIELLKKAVSLDSAFWGGIPFAGSGLAQRQIPSHGESSEAASEYSQVTQCASGHDRKLLALLSAHLHEALKINRVLHMERLRTPQGHEAMAIVYPDGSIYHAEPAFMALLRGELSIWDAKVLPQAVWRPVQQNGGYAGNTVVVRQVYAADLAFLKARRRTAFDALSERERTVAQHVVRGLTHKEIARVLGTSPQTVRNQIQAIHDKLGVRNSAELIAQVHLSV